MEFINLNKSPLINNIRHGTHVNILDVTDNTCNVNISNFESTTYCINIINNDMVNSIQVYIDSISDLEV